MSLGTRLTLKTAAIVGALLALAAVALWGLSGLNRDLDAALDEYDRLAQTYELAVTIERVRGVLRTDASNAARLRPMVTRALLELEDEDLVLGEDVIGALRADLLAVTDAIDSGVGPARAAALSGPLNEATQRLFNEANRIETRIAEVGRSADARRAKVTRWVWGAAVIASALAIGVGFWQYLAVMRPLRRLGRGVNRLAGGDFSQKLRATGDREFVRLAEDFNQMADELQGLYQSLEEKVRLRSRQLAQSERLASVGFLAAGVAHEINNPLAIIAGEAELALQQLAGGEPDDPQAAQGLATIRDEAFRCKAITQKLISLARPGSGERARVDLLALAQEVATLVRTLPQHEGRVLDVAGTVAVAETDPSQVRQVLLNLVINALEASPIDGRVTVRVAADAAAARVAVIDRGRGMAEPTLAKVFEPFYTEKKSPSAPGLGLGLSISHAIINELGGRLTAASEGLGQGSTFTIELSASGARKEQS